MRLRMSNIDLSIIIISHNTKELLENCVRSIILNTKRLKYEIIIIDNASSDSNLIMIRENFPNIRCLANPKNVGFAKACNQGIKIALGEHILLLNSDTVINDNCLGTIFEFIISKPQIGVLGCKVLNANGSLQYTCRHILNFISDLIFFTKNIIKNFWDPITYYLNMSYWNHECIKEVEFLSGCFLWVRKEVLNKVGIFDENFFMYKEDEDFCMRVKKVSAYSIVYFPFSSIVHYGGGSSEITGSKLCGCKMHYASSKYFIKKLYGPMAMRVFDMLCKTAWKIEVLFFSLLQFNKKFRDKVLLLRALLSE